MSEILENETPRDIEELDEQAHNYDGFLRGTQILMGDGSTKNIEDIQIGEEVMSYDVDLGEMVPQIVVGTTNRFCEEAVKYIFDDDSELTCCADNIFWVPACAEYKVPEVGDTIKGSYSEKTVVNIEFLNSEELNNENFYELDIEEIDNYFADGLLVHNPPPIGPDGPEFNSFPLYCDGTLPSVITSVEFSDVNYMSIMSWVDDDTITMMSLGTGYGIGMVRVYAPENTNFIVTVDDVSVTTGDFTWYNTGYNTYYEYSGYGSFPIFEGLHTASVQLNSGYIINTDGLSYITYTGERSITDDVYATLTATSGYSLPFEITVTGCQYDYTRSTGAIHLYAPTENVYITASGVPDTTYNLAQLFLSVGDRNIKVKATAPTVPDSNFSNQETYPLVYTITGTATNCTINNQSSCVKGARDDGTAIIPVEADGINYVLPLSITVEDRDIDLDRGWVTITDKCQIRYVTESVTTGTIQLQNIVNNITFSLSGILPYDGIVLKPTSLDGGMTALTFTTF